MRISNYIKNITPHLWFNKEAKEAAEFYVSVFNPFDSAQGKLFDSFDPSDPAQAVSKITHISTLHDTPSGDCDIVSFELARQPFMAISAGPLFKLNPSISFMVNFDPGRDKDAREHLNQLWEKLSAGGTALMPLDTYPFSERYGWIQDKYSVSWQLILSDPKGEERPFIVPSLMFVGEVCGKAEEATDFYMSVFKGSKRGIVARYPKGAEPDKEGTVMFTDFQIADQWFAGMDSAHMHDFAFSEAISLIVPCENQDEIDYYWEKLSAHPEAEQCGWLKDKYGLSWQVWPTALGEMMGSGTPEQVSRVTQAFLQMKKFDIAKLKQAYEGK